MTRPDAPRARMARFVPLACSSWYSLAEGVDSPAALLDRAADHGYPALALTDTNSLAGAVEFVEASRRTGVSPIIGARFRQQALRAVALVQEPDGWRSLCRVLFRLHQPKAPPLPRLLAENASGLHLLVDDPAM